MNTPQDLVYSPLDISFVMLNGEVIGRTVRVGYKGRKRYLPDGCDFPLSKTNSWIPTPVQPNSNGRYTQVIYERHPSSALS